jgi:hypothetical protein
MHDPAEPVIAHDLHVPLQSLAQQVPCSQKPESQSPGIAQAAPTGFRPQLPVVHMFDRHCALSVQVVRQSPVEPQRYGEHDCVAPNAQLPRPSQRDASTRVKPLHDCGKQIVPAG